MDNKEEKIWKFYNTTLKKYPDINKIYFRILKNTLTSKLVEDFLSSENISAHIFESDISNNCRSLKIKHTAFSEYLWFDTYNDSESPQSEIEYLVWFNHKNDIDLPYEFWSTVYEYAEIIQGEYPNKSISKSKHATDTNDELVKWHDLSSDPNDLPENPNQVLVAFARNTKTGEYYGFDVATYFSGAKEFITNTFNGSGGNNGDRVIAWKKIK